MSTFTAATLLNIIVKIYKQTKSSNKKKKNCFLINSLESGEKAVKMTMSLTNQETYTLIKSPNIPILCSIISTSY